MSLNASCNMGFRTVVIKSRVKLEHRLNYLVIRGEVEKKIAISEINTLILQSTAIALTASLLCELMDNNVKVIFCDKKCNPSSELLPYYGAHNVSGRIKEQIEWSDEIKKQVWREIIIRKITEQSNHLSDLGYEVESKLLSVYASEVTDGDSTNREGHAAKVYFNRLFGEDGTRRKESFANTCLNYGYAVVLSAVNREIAACGYLTQLGIWHRNEYNNFNLGCDFIEPLRVFVDRKMLTLNEATSDYKREMTGLLCLPVLSDEKNTTLDIAIRTYVRSIFGKLNGNGKDIIFPRYICLQ